MAMIRPETEMKDSGIEWIGDIPANWRKSKLKYLGVYINGYAFKPSDWSARGRQIIRIQDLTGSNSGEPNYFNGTLDEKYRVVNGDILVSWAATLDAFIWTKEDGWLNQHIFKAVPNEKIVKGYFLWLLKIAMDNMNNDDKHGIVMQHVTIGLFNNYVVPLAPYTEQQAIADYLDKTCSKIDEIIAEAKANIDEYKELKIAAVNDAVTHGIYNNAAKDSNVDWIGKIPDNWKIIITKRLFKIKKDIAGKEGYTVLSITQKGIVPKVFGGKGQFAADYSNYQLVNKGDFAMNHMDLLTGWLDISEYNGVTSPDYRVFVPTGYEDIYAPYYKYVMQNCYSCRIYYGLGHGVAGMGRWRLPADMFLNFKLPMPPKAEQKEIADFLDKRTAEIDSLIAEKESLIADLEAYKKSLIYEVVTGKRRVV